MHFFSKRSNYNSKEKAAVNNLIKVDDSLCENIYERLLKNEMMKFTNTQGSEEGFEPTHEIINTFYKMYDVFKESMLLVDEHNIGVKEYNEKTVLPFYEKNDFKVLYDQVIEEEDLVKEDNGAKEDEGKGSLTD